MADKIYINLMPNPKKQPGDNQPAFIGPKNEKYPDKNWTIGVKIGESWYNQAAFESSDMETGEPNGGLTVILTPAEGASKSAGNTRGNYQQKSFGNNNFQRKQNFGNKQNYRY
tara:strand:- start:32 stop:370 length:339 start_codon:yes stop_codon:yes gene_type:complete